MDAEDVPQATRQWILRKVEAGVGPDELKAQLESDGEDPAMVDMVLRSEGLQRAAPGSGTAGYLDTVRSVFGVDERYLRTVGDRPLPRLAGYAAVNCIGFALLPLLGLGALLAMAPTLDATGGMAATVAGAVAGPVLLAAWVGLVAHLLVALLGGTEGAGTTVRLYLALTALYLVLWIPYLGLLMLPYGAMVTVRGLELSQDLNFYRALLVTLAAPILALVVPGLILLVAV